MFGFDSFASRPFADHELRGTLNPRELSQAVTLDFATMVADHVLSPADLQQTMTINPILGFDSNTFTNEFDALLISSMAKREFLVTLTPFKLRSEHPTT